MSNRLIPLTILISFIIISLPNTSQAQSHYLLLPPDSWEHPAPREEAQPEDRWLAIDKLAHFLVSLSLVGMSYALLNGRGLEIDPDQARLISAGSVALLGLAKEFQDSRRGSGFSYKDLVADGIGIAVGITIFTFY